MSLNRTLLFTCAAIATLVTVRSQATSASSTPAPAPAPLFGDMIAPVQPVAPSPAAAPVPQAPKRASAPAPFVVDLPKPVVPAAAGEADERPEAVDESALRYFAAQNDLGRVAAEIRRLRSKHSDWEPPQDLFVGDHSGIDEQPLWDLFAKHDLDGVRAGMDSIRKDKPDWQPSSDLAGKLALAEAHDALVKASDAKEWGSVLDVAAANKLLLTCGDVDSLWRTAEALQKTGDEARSLEAYRYVLATCTPADLRLATVQKASLVLTSPEDLDSLIKMGKHRADGRSEFEQVRLDQVRRKIGAAASGASVDQPSQGDIDAVAAHAAGSGGQADADLLGWYVYGHKDFGGAQKWFRTAMNDGSDPKAAEGLVLALRDGGDADLARKVSIENAGLGDGNRKLMVEALSAALTDPKAAALTATDLSALTRAVDEAKSADGAQTLGWHFYKASNLAAAESWFQKSADWQANESAAVGLVVTARRLHHDRDYEALIAKYASLYPKIAELESVLRKRPTVIAVRRHDGRLVRVARAPARHTGSGSNTGGAWDASAEQIVKTYESGQYDAAMALMDQRRQKRAEPRGLSVVRGWALYHKGDWEGAKQVFSSLDGGQYSREQQEGLRVIQEGYTPLHAR